jgi:hypothetical protein
LADAISALVVAEGWLVRLGHPGRADMLADLRHELEADIRLDE